INLHYEKRKKIHADQSLECSRHLGDDRGWKKLLLDIANANGFDDRPDCRSASADTFGPGPYTGGRLVHEAKSLCERTGNHAFRGERYPGEGEAVLWRSG